MAVLKIDITAPDIDDFLEKMRRFPLEANKALDRGLTKSFQELRIAAKAETPMVTGKLRRGFRIQKLSSLKAIIFNRVFYGIFVHEGTKRHIIRPVIKKALFWKGADHPVKMVNHPGQKPNPFLQRAVEKTARRREEIFKEEMDKALRKIATR